MVISKLRKMFRDPVGYCLDSRHVFLQTYGEQLFAKQTECYRSSGRENAHRKITVIMTAYNTGDLVEGAVQSVLAQCHENFELMIIDDASTDNTLDVLQRLKTQDTRIKLFHSPVNHGTYWSKNWCLSKAEGEFVAFHDSDDFSDPERLQLQLGAMVYGKGVDAVTCRWSRVNPEGQRLTIDGTSSRTAIISMMIRRAEVLKKVGYFDTVRIAADTEYHQRISKVFGYNRVRNMRHVLYTGLLRDQSLTRGENGGFHWQANGNSITRTVSGSRANYMQAFKLWHKSGKSLFVPFPQKKRSFPVPEVICRSCDDMDVSQVLLSTEENVA